MAEPAARPASLQKLFELSGAGVDPKITWSGTDEQPGVADVINGIVSKNHAYKLIKQKKFPKQMQGPANASVWSFNEVLNWYSICADENALAKADGDFTQSFIQNDINVVKLNRGGA